MAKREFIDRKKFIGKMKQSNGLDISERMKFSNLIEEQRPITEQEIVKPYLEKLKADIEVAYDELDGYDPDALGTFASRIDDLIDNLLSESEGK